MSCLPDSHPVMQGTLADVKKLRALGARHAQAAVHAAQALAKLGAAVRVKTAQPSLPFGFIQCIERLTLLLSFQ